MKPEKLPSDDRTAPILDSQSKIFAVRQAMLQDEWNPELTGDPCSQTQLPELKNSSSTLKRLTKNLYESKREGFFSVHVDCYTTKTTEDEVRTYRKYLGIIPVYKTVDTCAAEFEELLLLTITPPTKRNQSKTIWAWRWWF